MPNDRQLVKIWEILRLLQGADDGLTTDQLARRSAVSEKALSRYLEIIAKAGFPIRTSGKGNQKKYSSLGDKDGHTPIPMTVANLISIYMSANLLSFLDGTPYQAGLADVLEKIQATLPESTIQRLEEIRRSFFAIKNPVREYSKHAGLIATMNEALLSRQRVRLRYLGPRWKNAKQYSLAPYAIFLYKQALYAVGHVRQYDEIRFFAVKRMQSVTILKEKFSVPKDFSLDDYLADAFGLIRGTPQTVRIHFDSSIASIVEETVWHPSQKIKHLPDGSLELSLHVGGLEEVLWWVLSYGSGARVLEPPELVSAVKNELLGMTSQYLDR